MATFIDICRFLSGHTVCPVIGTNVVEIQGTFKVKNESYNCFLTWATVDSIFFVYIVVVIIKVILVIPLIGTYVVAIQGTFKVKTSLIIAL